MTQHPPLHYIATALATWPLKATWPGALSFDQEIWLYRLANVALLAPLPLLTFAVCRELDVPLAGSMLSAVFLVAIPGLTMRNGAMVNNDNLLTLLSGCAIYLAVRIASGATAPKYAVLIGGVVGLASLTKGFGILLPVTVALAYVVVARRRRMARPVRWWFARVGVAGSVAFVAGMWWWARNLIVLGTLQPSGIDVPATPGFSWVHWLRELLFVPWTSFWSGSFVLAMGTDSVLLYALMSVMVAGLCASVMVCRDHDLPGLLVALSSLFVLMAWLYIQRIVEGRLTGLQGRYFYGAVVAIAAAVGAGWAALSRRLARWLPAAAVVGAAVVTTIGFLRLAVRHWGETGDPLSARWMAIEMWSPVEPSVLQTAVAITVFGFVGTLIWAVRFGLLSDASTPDGR